MATTTITRKDLDKAHTMMLVGEISDGYEDSKQFTPSHCPHLLHNRAVVIGGSKPQVSPEDEAEIGHEFIQLGDPNDGIICTVTCSQLLVNRSNAIILLRNNRPFNAGTLHDVVSLNPKRYSVAALDAGASLVLKEGDVLLVKNTSCVFSIASARYPAPGKLHFNHLCKVYVCLPKFAADAMQAFRRPGVVRELRLKIEMFVEVWIAQWDAGTKSVVYTVDDSLRKQYRNQSFEALRSVAKKVVDPLFDPSAAALTDSEADEPAVAKTSEADVERMAKKAKANDNAA
jgi:hypothetical protein